MNPHEEFLQLCAVSTSGELTGEERRKLDEHLLGCASCRKALHEFRQTVTSAVPAIAAQLPPDASELDRSWSLDAAESALFDRLSKEDNQVKLREATKDPMEGSDQARHAAYFPSQFRWGQMWMSYAAAVFLFAALAISAYRVGIHRGVEVATNLPIAPGTGSKLSYEEQISDLSHERETLRAQLASREAAIADLKEKISRFRATDSARFTNFAKTPNEAGKVTSGESVLAMARIADLEKELDAEKRARSEDSSRAATLEAKLGQLSEQLRERDETVASQMRRLDGRDGSFEQQQAKIAEQQELLEHDRDIRELMGARDLYIAEVYDVAKNGATQKSYGRIFFTKGKSLIFYAYDLDRQPELKNASTFQAWGQRGTDRAQALNLGIFFEDNVSKKRWVLKFDDPNKLEQIDAVFVTVEPNGGSHKPSGKPFLFAYLKINANHP